MTLLDIGFGEIQLGDGSVVMLDFEFETQKTFGFSLKNPAPRDQIFNIQLITNLPDEVIINKTIPQELGPLDTSLVNIEFNADALDKFYENNPNFKPKIGFTYNRKRFLF